MQLCTRLGVWVRAKGADIMQDQGGFVKIYRKMTEWEWYDDVNTKVVFLHILLKANWKEKKWHGEIIHAGEYKTTLPELCDELKLTPRNVRTALEHLKMSGAVTVRTTSKYRIITVNNWDEYQHSDSQAADKGQTIDSETANKRQTATSVTHLKKCHFASPML